MEALAKLAPRSRSSFSCAGVSMPSAMTVFFSEWRA